MTTLERNGIEFRLFGARLRIEPWGANSLRVREVPHGDFGSENWALSERIENPPARICSSDRSNQMWRVENGRIAAEVNANGVLSFFRDGAPILREYHRCYEGAITEESRCLRIPGREWKSLLGADTYHLTVRFESMDEMLFGMGQYQQRTLNLKGCILELVQRNSQATVPFAVSSLGYGFLWNNPAVGKVMFGNNYSEWTALATRQMDYWITAGEDPREILMNYTAVTGRASMFPEELMGLWQSKLRYRTQEEVLEVARRAQAEGIHLDEIVIDFFHWPYQGDWTFDPVYWPDPKAMIDELHAMGTKVMVSVWPSVDRRSKDFDTMLAEGFLIRTERGSRQTYDYQGDCVEIDPFSEETRRYIWDKCKKNYYDLGINSFWLDNAEPDLVAYDFENYRYAAGPALTISNMYPQMYSRAFYEPMHELQDTPVVNLVRSCWAGSQKYGNVIWSGDVPSTFAAFADQIQAGLNMGLAGIPWWTTDIGGFMTDDWQDPAFIELLIRWFQFAVFSPVLRMHGDRGPHDIPPLDDRDWGGGYLYTGHENELWSFGQEPYAIMCTYYQLRLSLHDYIVSLFREAHEYGVPLMRTMFFEFPADPVCWKLQDQYMFGSRFLVAPILEPGCKSRIVYLPEGEWRLTSTGESCRGKQSIRVETPLSYMPVFERCRTETLTSK